MNRDPWAEPAATKWNPDTAALHDRDAHRRDRHTNAWPTCPRCSDIAVQFHDQHAIAHLVPADVRYRYEQERTR